jgi:dihydroorotate dehydrogenase (fumarate)
MVNLKTTYLGLELKNPVIVSSSGLTDSVDKIKNLEIQGAAAVVLKSLFEEQIKVEAGILKDKETSQYPEASDYISTYVKDNAISNYLTLIKDAKAAVSIPVIASINCYSADEWIYFAKEIESAGADALELNIYYIPIDKDFTSADFENIYFEICLKIKETIKLPVAIKLGSNFTNPSYLVEQLYFRGASGVVLFNRFYETDIDITTLKLKPGNLFSHEYDIRNTLRWVAITSSQVPKIDISASTGVHSSEAAIKLLLAGAQTVQVCSVLYKHGPSFIKTILEGITSWMELNNREDIKSFRGQLNYKNIEDPAVYERAQFMKYFSSQL